MSKDKYPSIFSPQMATIVFIILQIFFATSSHIQRALVEYIPHKRTGPQIAFANLGGTVRLKDYNEYS